MTTLATARAVKVFYTWHIARNSCYIPKCLDCKHPPREVAHVQMARGIYRQAIKKFYTFKHWLFYFPNFSEA